MMPYAYDTHRLRAKFRDVRAKPMIYEERAAGGLMTVADFRGFPGRLFQRHIRDHFAVPASCKRGLGRSDVWLSQKAPAACGDPEGRLFQFRRNEFRTCMLVQRDMEVSVDSPQPRRKDAHLGNMNGQVGAIMVTENAPIVRAVPGDSCKLTAQHLRITLNQLRQRAAFRDDAVPPLRPVLLA